MTGGCKRVGIDETMDYRIVITALEVIPSRFCLVLVPARHKTGRFCGAIAAAAECLSGTDSRGAFAQNCIDNGLL